MNPRFSPRTFTAYLGNPAPTSLCHLPVSIDLREDHSVAVAAQFPTDKAIAHHSVTVFFIENDFRQLKETTVERTFYCLIHLGVLALAHCRVVGSTDISTRNFRYSGQPATNLYALIVTMVYNLNTRDRPGLLFAMMRTFASDNSRIAFEGNLATTELYGLAGASYEETAILKRNTVASRLDFVILPLALGRVPSIQKAIQSKVAFTGYRGIIHVQIEANGDLAFGAYDSFHEETVLVYAPIDAAVLDDLVATKTLRAYTPVLERRM